MTFAKIFESETIGQLCCIAAAENDESHPEIRVFCVPKNLGVCSSALIFSDTDAGWAAQEKAFDELTLKAAENIAMPVIEMANKF